MLWEALINKNLRDVKRGQGAKQPVFAGLREERVMGKKETDERGKGSQRKDDERVGQLRSIITGQLCTY